MPHAEFRPRGPAGSEPAILHWNGRCEHGPDDTCFCLMLTTTALHFVKSIWPDADGKRNAEVRGKYGLNPPADDDKIGFGYTLSLDAETADRLIATLQQARREVFGLPAPSAPVVEIIEAGDRKTETGPGSLLMPSALLINGVPVYTSGGIRVHEMEITVPKEMAQVTVTMPVRLLTIAAEGDLQPGRHP